MMRNESAPAPSLSKNGRTGTENFCGKRIFCSFTELRTACLRQGIARAGDSHTRANKREYVRISLYLYAEIGITIGSICVVGARRVLAARLSRD